MGRCRAEGDGLLLLGRHAECRRGEQLLSEARAGRSGALVMRGEAGIGKTAVLEFLHTKAEELGFQIETSTGIEAETQFAYAGLHQVCAPLLDQISALPEPQQSALSVALGRDVGSAPDRFLVGLDRKSTRLNSSHVRISYAVFCLKKKKTTNNNTAET